MTKRLNGRAGMARRARILRANPLCVLCPPDRPRPATEVDHIKRLADGGSDTDDNLQGLCHDCHARKTADEDGKTKRTGCTASGWPTDPLHPWNKSSQWGG